MLETIRMLMDARGRFLSTADQRDIATVLRVVESELERRIQLIRFCSAEPSLASASDAEA